MRKSVLCKAVFTIVMACAIVGCVGLGNKEPVSQKTSVIKVMQEWKQAFEAKNLDGLMATLSPETFTCDKFGTYAQSKAGLSDLIARGELDEASVNLDTATITIEDEKATVFPVGVKAKCGEATLSFQLRFIEDKWLIVGIRKG